MKLDKIFHNQTERKATPSQRKSKIWLASLVILPYVSYLGLLIMLGLWIGALLQRGGQVWRLCMQRGFGWLAAGLLLSSCFAWDRGESFLQLVNFLPFFIFFGVLATVPAAIAQPVRTLETLARWLVVTAMPMTALAVVEYGLKFESIIPRIQALPLPNWLLTWLYGEDFGHRAHSIFGHPNGLSAYLVIVLGLGLGLIVKGLGDRKPDKSSYQASAALTLSAKTLNSELNTKPNTKHNTNALNASDLSSTPQTPAQKITQVVAVALTLAAIFCTGSRNGVLIAWVLMAIALYAARKHRGVLIAGLMGSGAIAAAVLSLGIGGRAISLALITQDPRIGVWQLAIEMVQQKPWLGWGFAALRLRYVPGSIPDYDIIYHAHNVWLYLASEAGIPVMIGFCVVIGTLYYDGIKAFIQGGLTRAHRAILLSYLLAFTSCLLFGLFDVTLFDSRLNILSYGLLSGIYILSHAQPTSPGKTIRQP